MRIKYRGVEYLYVGDHPEHPCVVLQTPDNTYIDVTLEKWVCMLKEYTDNCSHNNIRSKYIDMPDNKHHEMLCNDCGLTANVSGEELANYGSESHYKCMRWESVGGGR